MRAAKVLERLEAMGGMVSPNEEGVVPVNGQYK